MSYPPDKLGEKPADLPNPELNPLLNPVLGRHLGQWAHVYFTTPPEKRDEALFELIDDLKSKEEAGEAPNPKSPAMPESADGIYAMVCPRCERSNVRSQKYCGMCGALMPVRAQAAAAASANPSAAHAMFDQATSAVNAPREEAFETRAPEAFDVHRTNLHREESLTTQRSPFASTSLLFQPEPEEAEVDRSELPDSGGPDHTRRPVDIDWLRERSLANEEEDGRSRWITYLMGTAILLCIGVLTFLLAIRPELRGKAAAKLKPPVNWNITQNAPTQSPRVVPETPSAADEPVNNSPATKETSPSAPPATKTPTIKTRPSKSDAASARPHPAEEPNVTSNPQSTTTPNTIEGGAAELAVARDYLSGKNGPPNGQAAAQMLWKAIAKKNSTALLLLSDLYASGNGVVKSCDQARLLLDAALQKNVPTADYKLKILQQTCR